MEVVHRDSLVAFKRFVRGPYLIGGREAITDELATRIVQLMRTEPQYAPSGVLAGRGFTRTQQIDGLGRVFIKQYAHGGLLRRVTGGYFLAGGPSRSLLEFEMLERVRSLGVNAPRPLVFVNKGSFLYRSWLFMEEIANSKNLAEIGSGGGIDGDAMDLLHHGMTKLGQQVLKLINNRILHVDLHPGNVLLNSAGEIFIVDFDKARDFSGSSDELRDLYLRRWRRAVIKHKLSPILTELMSLILRSHPQSQDYLNLRNQPQE